MTTQPADQVLTPQDLVDRWKNTVSVRTLANWRSTSTGPKYVKIGGRIIYKLKFVEEFEERRTVEGTASYIR